MGPIVEKGLVVNAVNINGEMFKGLKDIVEADDESELTLVEGVGHSGKGVYAYFSDYPEEGSMFLGEV